MTQAASPTKVTSGGNHHRSVRNVFAAIAARARPPRLSAGAAGLVVVVVIPALPDRAQTVGAPRERRRSPQPSSVRNVWHTLRRGSGGFSVRSGWVRHSRGRPAEDPLSG